MRSDAALPDARRIDAHALATGGTAAVARVRTHRARCYPHPPGPVCAIVNSNPPTSTPRLRAHLDRGTLYSVPLKRSAGVSMRCFSRSHRASGSLLRHWLRAQAHNDAACLQEALADAAARAAGIVAAIGAAGTARGYIRRMRHDTRCTTSHSLTRGVWRTRKGDCRGKESDCRSRLTVGFASTHASLAEGIAARAALAGAPAPARVVAEAAAVTARGKRVPRLGCRIAHSARTCLSGHRCFVL